MYLLLDLFKEQKSRKRKSTVVYVNAENTMISVKTTGCLLPILSDLC